MNWYEFSRINRHRSESPTGFNHKLESWSLSDWMTATLGELGEAANVVKKLNRERDGVRGNTESANALRAKLASELADTFIYLDLLAQAAGIDLPQAVIDTFNRKSHEIGCKTVFTKLPTMPPLRVSQHTPGPWGHGLGNMIRDKDGRGSVLARMNDDGDRGSKPIDEMTANLNLMIASPDMYTALLAARAFGAQGETDEGVSVSYLIENAIAKVEAGQ